MPCQNPYMSVVKASSMSVAQINGDILASEIEPGQGNSSAPDRCCMALNARPPNARKMSLPEREACPAASAELEGRLGSNDAVPFVRFIWLLMVEQAVLEFR